MKKLLFLVGMLAVGNVRSDLAFFKTLSARYAHGKDNTEVQRISPVLSPLQRAYLKYKANAAEPMAKRIQMFAEELCQEKHHDMKIKAPIINGTVFTAWALGLTVLMNKLVPQQDQAWLLHNKAVAGLVLGVYAGIADQRYGHAAAGLYTLYTLWTCFGKRLGLSFKAFCRFWKLYPNITPGTVNIHYTSNGQGGLAVAPAGIPVAAQM